MLIRAGEILTKNIVSFDSEVSFGHVKDIALSTQFEKIIGIYYQNSGLLKSELKIINLDNIVRIEHQNITINKDKNNVLKEIKDIEKFSFHKGKKIISSAGKELGNLEDIVFSMNDGHVKFLEISDGVISDLINGRKQIAVENLQIIDKDYLIVKWEVS